jgi:hypothetical protein
LGLPRPHPRRFLLQALKGLAFLLGLLFLLANLLGRGASLHAAGEAWGILAVAIVLGGWLCVWRPVLLAPVLGLFGASFFLYGFHSYRLQNQVFEYLVTVLSLVLLIHSARVSRPPAGSCRWVLGGWVLYAVLALFSLVLMPPAVLGDRVFLEEGDVFGATLRAFPSDPLYPIAGVNRLLLFVFFVALLARHRDSRRLYRVLFRGVAAATVVAVVLGLLDFSGVLTLAPYNLSRLFYGAGYDRLQSTFANPAWFASFVACALPFVLLELWQGGRRTRFLLGISFPLSAACLFFAAARAAWLASAWLILALLLIVALKKRGWIPVPPLGRAVWLALGSSVAVFLLLATSVYGPLVTGPPVESSSAPSGRTGGLAREMRIRGLGVDSPRWTANAYALEMAGQRPVYGLGYETFNLHLRAQLAVAGSRVARIVNPGAEVDPGDTFFDDAHNTYLQILVGTGVVGLLIWLTLGAVGLLFVGLEVWRDGTPVAVCVLLAMLVFHLYGLFQGMQYIPVVWLLFLLTTGWAMTVTPGRLSPGLRRTLGGAYLMLGLLVVLSPIDYVMNRGYRDIKERFGLSAYLPDEREEFVGFYRPESGPQGEFHWMARRGIINLARPDPFRLLIACEHPDLDREPVVLSFRFNGDPAGRIVLHRKGQVEKRFDFAEPGTLRLTVSRTFRPGPKAADRRELGVAIGAIRWE